MRSPRARPAKKALSLSCTQAKPGRERGRAMKRIEAPMSGQHDSKSIQPVSMQRKQAPEKGRERFAASKVSHKLKSVYLLPARYETADTYP